jgi:hypothetical protein
MALSADWCALRSSDLTSTEARTLFNSRSHGCSLYAASPNRIVVTPTPHYYKIVNSDERQFRRRSFGRSREKR